MTQEETINNICMLLRARINEVSAIIQKHPPEIQMFIQKETQVRD